ncbi:AMP-binding protein [Sansalvadorimonas sp. 2012CJ34-2]|uniref:Long-chain-fatty-acid--CoA ligase n=1 Tax=Parendozoicomonas callyspongiae TaxID=2942213 RepID=A0ABT0PFH7_9GAMM|nr:AMP-binding protein [Sansalvadorimonas sp. 2012CJ34-2]MCL6269293.1 AMP-binding protein [Sansalvadorimonas sp. 2012CJ34-2]
MNRNFWADKYPEGVPAEITSESYTSILDVLDEACREFHDKPAFSNLGCTLTYGEIGKLSDQFAAWLQNATDLQPGDRIAVQLPNLLQFPIVTFGALKAGLIVVNTNPLYTECEMEHQFKDSGAKALVVLANMAHLAEAVLPKTSIKHVIVTEVGDMLNPIKRFIVNGVVKHVQKMVPAFNLPTAVPFNEVMSKGARWKVERHQADKNDTAVLQYTGGTTGIAKGAELTHGNIISNMEQIYAMVQKDIATGGELIVAPLPLYHIYSFTVHCMVALKTGMHNLLITNPRDLKSFVKDLKKYPYTMMVGLNTLFNGLMNNPDFQHLDFRRLKMTLSGGMALQMNTARRWKDMTGCDINEGYGMTEASPVVTLNPLIDNRLGTIGIPLSSTQLKIINDEWDELPLGEAGELCIKGPQVMKGYWQRPEETAKTLSNDGWLSTGDIATIDESGYVRIVDRKKDMISVSGFNVYPNELEDVLARHPDVVQCAAIGVPCSKTGERIKIFVVADNATLTPDDIRSHFRQYVTGYKVPKIIEFRDELPVSNIGKILRRQLRDEELAKLNEEPALTK